MTGQLLDNWTTQLRKGLLEMCVLNAIAGRRMYGYDIVRTLRDVEGLVITEGTVYPLLSRLRRDGLVLSMLEESAGGGGEEVLRVDSRRRPRAGAHERRLGKDRGGCPRDTVGPAWRTEMMVTLTDQARATYDEYIRKVRAYIAAAGSGNPDEVVADVRDHVDRELAGAAEPVAEGALRAVLARLGEPQQWIGEDDLPWWRKVLLRVRSGPDNWRLAYATSGVLLLGVIFGWVFCDTYTSYRYSRFTRHAFNWEAMGIFMVIALVLARATLAAGRPPALNAGQKWLVYPSLIVPYALIAAAIIAWAPAAGGAGGAFGSWSYLRQHARGQAAPGYYPALLRHLVNPDSLNQRSELFGVWAGVLSAGIWWTLLGVLLLFRRPRRLMEAVFAPFLKPMSRRWGTIVLLIGLLALTLVMLCAVSAHNWGHEYF